MTGLDRAATVLLGGGSVAIGAWGVLHPRSLAGLLGSSERAARLIGWRDLAVGVLLLRGSRPGRHLVRAACDVADAAAFGRSRPWIGAGAMAAAGLGVAAALAGRGGDRGSPDGSR